MSRHWRVRGHNRISCRLYWATSGCKPLQRVVMWTWHRWALAYWYRRDVDGPWERVA